MQLVRDYGGGVDGDDYCSSGIGNVVVVVVAIIMSLWL